MRWSLCLLLNLLLSASVFAHTGDTYVARLATPIVVDGDVSEWPADVWQDAAYHRTLLSEAADGSDLQAEFAVMWRDSLLYLAARVTDDVHHCERVDWNVSGEDAVWFTFTPKHEPDLWNSSIQWGYARSSRSDSTMFAPAGRFKRVPRGLVYVAQRVTRDEKKGVTIYEAIAKAPFTVEDGSVYGFDFSVSDNDGFQDGRLGTSPTSLTTPGHGGGDVVFVKGDARLKHLKGRVSEGSDGEPIRVHAFVNGVLKGSATCDANGRFDLALLKGKYRVFAYAGEQCSKPVSVSVSDSNPAVLLALTERTGTVNGRVVSADGKKPLPFASVFASIEGSLRARVFTDSKGRYTFTGLENGAYDLTCDVARGDTLKNVKVKRGETVDAKKPFKATLTFGREPADDALYGVLSEWLDYDRNLPLDVEIVESRNIENYVREKIVFSSTHDERVVGYLALPKESKGPFPCLLTLHAHDNPGKDRDDMELIRRRFTDIGYAVLALDAKYYNERHQKGQTVYDMRGQGSRRRDATIQTIVDYRRSIDFLATRSEIDTSRIGVFGGSMGAMTAMILAPVETRIKAVVLRGPGMSADQWVSTSMEGMNFLPRLGDRPVLILSGAYDGSWAVQGAQRIPEVLTGEAQIVWYKTTHTVPPELYLEIMLPWVRERL